MWREIATDLMEKCLKSDWESFLDYSADVLDIPNWDIKDIKRVQREFSKLRGLQDELTRVLHETGAKDSRQMPLIFGSVREQGS